MPVLIAERRFVIEAPQQRVWDLLGPSLLNSPIGLEKIEVIDEYNVKAEARIKLAFIPLLAKLHISFLELVEPDRMQVALTINSMAGLVKMEQRIGFALSRLGDKQTEVKCEAHEGRRPFLYPLLARKARSVTEVTLAGLEKDLVRRA